MKLFKLPEVVLWSVFSMMEVIEKMELSFCSRVSAAVLRRNGTIPITIKITIIPRMPYIEVFQTGREGLKQCKLYMQKGTTGFDEQDPMRNFGGIRVMAKWPPVGTVFCSTTHQPDKIMHSLIIHLLQVFPNCIVESLRINVIVYREQFDIKKALPRGTIINNAEMDGDRMYKDDLEYVLKELRVLNQLKATVTVVGQLSIDNTGSAANQIIVPANWISSKMFLNFQSEKIILTCLDLNSTDLQAFLRKWKRSVDEENSLRKLKFIEIQYLKKDQKLDFKELEGSPFVATPQHWRYIRKSAEYEVFNQVVYEQVSGINITNNDGIIGTFFASSGSYFFYVWRNGIQTIEGGAEVVDIGNGEAQPGAPE